MSSFGKTAIVYNNPNKLLGLPPYYYRLRSCDTNLTSNTPANQYQIQKLIQNTVRVYSSLYTSNLGPLNAYRQPITYGVCWNQMSDRPVPSVQRATVPTGFNNNLNSRHHSVTSSKPGSQTPGGVGCDIKHNSYDRYLNRIKGTRTSLQALLNIFGLNEQIVNIRESDTPTTGSFEVFDEITNVLNFLKLRILFEKIFSTLNFLLDFLYTEFDKKLL